MDSRKFKETYTFKTKKVNSIIKKYQKMNAKENSFTINDLASQIKSRKENKSSQKPPAVAFTMAQSGKLSRNIDDISDFNASDAEFEQIQTTHIDELERASNADSEHKTNEGSPGRQQSSINMRAGK